MGADPRPAAQASQRLMRLQQLMHCQQLNLPGESWRQLALHTSHATGFVERSSMSCC